VKNHRETYYQKDWAEIRGKTEQTVSNNASSARRDLFELPDHAPFETIGPALTQLSEDADDADIRLV
jgi:hypothetical protein